jgi:phosphopantothenoylcysteine decarboxylase/phosphopantothenate--cysteine ligase
MAPSRRMLITAGPTHEPLDAVRYIANRSSGRMGIALAEAARDAGWTVTLLLGPVALVPPAGVGTVSFESSADLARLLEQHFPTCDVLIMAAAVADYRPQPAREAKLPRRGEPLLLKLEPTPDLVAGCAARKRAGQRIIGFALEELRALEPRAREKLRDKGLDLIIANPLGTMGSAQVAATLFTATGQTVRMPMQEDGAVGVPKPQFARWLLAWIEREWYA